MRYHIYFYIDLYFIMNFIMNIMILYLLSTVMRLQIIWLRLILSAVIGSVFACILAIVPFMNHLCSILITYIVGGLLMICAAFPYDCIRETIKKLLCLWVIAAVLGGGMLSITGGEVMSFVPAILGMAGFVKGTKIILEIFRHMFEKQKNVCRVYLEYHKKSLEINGILDTGNQLYEPATKKPVHILYYGAGSHLCDLSAASIFIPYKSIGKEFGILPALEMDRMIIMQDKRKKEIFHPLIALSKEKVSSDNLYEIIVHS